PARGATAGTSSTCSAPACFNPRSRAGSDHRVLDPVDLRLLVSTHAPARGATTTGHAASTASTVSTHAPARGATSGTKAHLHRLEVSTHAPARGATGHRGPLARRRTFQPTLPRGERQRPWRRAAGRTRVST